MIPPSRNDYPAVMLDLETMGTGPRSAIVSIGAVAFDPMGTEPIETLPAFYRTVDLASCLRWGLEVDGPTVYWWLRQSEEARQALTAEAPTSLAVVLAEFRHWYSLVGSGEVWGHSTFDPVLLRSASDALSVELPWDHKRTRDIRTLCDLGAQLGIAVLPLEGGVKHRADDDARYQVHLVRTLVRAIAELVP